MLGTSIVYFTFIASITSIILYALCLSGKKEYIRLARISYLISTSGILLAAVLLLYLILTHKFQYTYVWSYSSNDLPFSLLISTFYAGQEGSFMLWALFTGVMGIVMMRYVVLKGFEVEVMTVYGLVQLFLIVMLLAKSPFVYVWETFPQDLIHSGPVPPNVASYVILDAAKSVWAQVPVQGKGLNPLLQNYWMVIHPPVLFLGFSALAVPFSLAMAGLMRRDYSTWIRIATPWSVFGAMILGAGIILGGYWAYETLGWGGYWAWDPVENSSLVPWLLCIAAIHTTVIQRKSGQFVRTNFLLSILAFIGVVYSTFLTRSGVLGDTSVHSFVDPGMWAYALLLGFLIIFSVIGIGLLLLRMKEMPNLKVEHSLLSREYALFLGASALSLVALFTLIGTSSPLITTFLKGKASAVDIDYYITTNLPLAIIVSLLAGLSQLLWWKQSKISTIYRTALLPSIIALVITVLVFLLGSANFLIGLFVFFSAFSFVANFQIGYAIFKGNPIFLGGSLSHIGVAIMCIGFVTSSTFSEKQILSLEKGKSIAAFGYSMTYTGSTQFEGEKFKLNIKLEKNGKEYTVAPVMYFSEYTNGVMKNPDVLNLVSRDIYIAPMEVEQAKRVNEQTIELQKDIPGKIDYLKLTLKKSGHSMDENGKKEQVVLLNAVIEIEYAGKKSPVNMSMKISSDGAESTPVSYTTSDGKYNYVFQLASVIPDQNDKSKIRARIVVHKLFESGVGTKEETLIVEASVKPFINLVWLGTITLIVGFAVTIFRRAKNSIQEDQNGWM